MLFTKERKCTTLRKKNKVILPYDTSQKSWNWGCIYLFTDAIIHDILMYF